MGAGIAHQPSLKKRIARPLQSIRQALQKRSPACTAVVPRRLLSRSGDFTPVWNPLRGTEMSVERLANTHLTILTGGPVSRAQL